MGLQILKNKIIFKKVQKRYTISDFGWVSLIFIKIPFQALKSRFIAISRSLLT